jgi:hypothetical protein
VLAGIECGGDESGLRGWRHSDGDGIDRRIRKQCKWVVKYTSRRRVVLANGTRAA